VSLSYSTWREFVPLVQMSIPKCPIPTIMDAVRRAAMEFCKETELWRHTSDPSDVIADQVSYDCTVDEPGIEVAGVVTVKMGGVKVHPASGPEWDGLAHDQTHTQARFYRFVEPGLIQLWPTPSETRLAVLQVEVSLMPTIVSTRGPSFLLTRYDKAMAAGTKRNLMEIPDQPWSDPHNAAYQGQIFKSEMAAARINEERGGTRKSLTVKRRAFI
jgi:hypothetical protein